MEKASYFNRVRWHTSPAKLCLWTFVFSAAILIFFFRSPATSPLPADPSRRSLRSPSSWGGPVWEKRVRSSARVRS
ncbi:UDP-glucuronate 4-epimerase 3-like, partial [Trifolium medium]|nr:UDP-glucuronate 4-epimerase 3-like [Trifolium medium]